MPEVTQLSSIVEVVVVLWQSIVVRSGVGVVAVDCGEDARLLEALTQAEAKGSDITATAVEGCANCVAVDRGGHA